MRVFLTALTYVVSFALVAVVAFFSVLIIAGPHSGMLPGWLEAVVLVLGWVLVLLVPALAARFVWRRLNAIRDASRKSAE